MAYFRCIATNIYSTYLTLGIKLWRHKHRDPQIALEVFRSYEHFNCALKTATEVQDAIRNLRRLKVFRHPDWPKNWDTCRSLAFILTRGSAESSVFDVGCGGYGGVILPSLALYGYKKLYGCDLDFARDFKRGPISYLRKDLLRTDLPSESFDFITCISVIEHGVPLHAYFLEMMRLLRPGGYLITSTDFWFDPINTKGLLPPWKMLGEVKIFDLNAMKDAIGIAQDVGFELYEPMDYSCKDKVVYWKEVNLRFTYLQFILRKPLPESLSDPGVHKQR